jgi:hypothetical protein
MRTLNGTSSTTAAAIWPTSDLGVDGVVLDADPIDGVTETGGDGLAFGGGGIDGLGDGREEIACEGGVGGGGEHDGHGGEAAGDGVGERGDAGGQIGELEREVAVERVAVDIHQDGETVAARDDEGFAGLVVVAGGVGDREHEGGLHFVDFDAVGETRAAAGELVDDFDDVNAVGGDAHAHGAVGMAGGIVVVAERFSLGVEHGEHGVERRTEAAGEDLEIEVLVFFRGEAEEGGVAFGGEHAVEREGQGRRDERGVGERGAGLDGVGVGKRDGAEPCGRRREAVV